MVAEITRINAKRRRKEPLTPEEREYSRSYTGRYNKARTTVRATIDELQAWEDEARGRGQRPSTYIVHLIRKGRRGNEEEIASLKRQLQQSEDHKAALTAQMGTLATERGDLALQLQRIDEELLDGLERLLKDQAEAKTSVAVVGEPVGRRKGASA